MALALAELDGCLQSKRLSAVDKGITEGFDSLSESRVASHPAQFDESLAFKRRCLPSVAIVLPKGVKTGGQRAFRAKGAQAQVDLKGPRASRHDEIKERVPELVMLRQKMIGLKVFELREKAGMTRAQVAEKTAMTAEKIEQIEQGNVDISVSELEFLVRAVQGVLDDLVEDRGPVGNWLQAQKDFEAFAKMPSDLRSFVLKPINRSYIELAVKLSQMQVDQLRSIAEGILEITF